MPPWNLIVLSRPPRRRPAARPAASLPTRAPAWSIVPRARSAPPPSGWSPASLWWAWPVAPCPRRSTRSTRRASACRTSWWPCRLLLLAAGVLTRLLSWAGSPTAPGASRPCCWWRASPPSARFLLLVGQGLPGAARRSGPLAIGALAGTARPPWPTEPHGDKRKASLVAAMITPGDWRSARSWPAPWRSLGRRRCAWSTASISARSWRWSPASRRCPRRCRRRPVAWPSTCSVCTCPPTSAGRSRPPPSACSAASSCVMGLLSGLARRRSWAVGHRRNVFVRTVHVGDVRRAASGPSSWAAAPSGRPRCSEWPA